MLLVSDFNLSSLISSRRYDPGGGSHSVVFLWHVPEKRSVNENMMMASRILEELRPQLPEYHTRATLNEFKREMSSLCHTNIPAHIL